MTTFGTIAHSGKHYRIDAVPQVRMMLRRVFLAADKQSQKSIILSDTLQNSEMLAWFIERYPMEPVNGALDHLRSRAETSVRLKGECDSVMRGDLPPAKLPTKLPLRPYQCQAVELLTRKMRLLVGDDLGLGKTAIALGAIAGGANPAVIVCQTHLQKQWQDEALKFLRGCLPHIVKKATPYQLPAHNLLIVPYSKVAGWADHLDGYELVCFDEAQELRHEGTRKYIAARRLSSVCNRSLGLTATPIYNYGDEIFNVLDAIDPGALGGKLEFLSEWCVPIGNMKYKVSDPAALGSYLAEHHLFLRRRRADVGRELPPVTKVSQTIDHDPKRLAMATAHGLQLAKAVLGGSFEERGMAARELDALMRQQTGIAKAPFVAAFVIDMVKSGEPVVLCGWHRDVYDVWLSVFEGAGVRAVLYTGSESAIQKNAAVDAFVNGAADVFIMSLRSGAGLNRLQERAGVIVFGELDWSPQVHEQCIGRLQRDGQAGNVTAIFLVSEGGSDPVIAGVLGLKREQSEGLINPETADAPAPMSDQVTESRAAILARSILKHHA